MSDQAVQSDESPVKKQKFFLSLPKRWLEYDPVGRDILGTRFVPFKTPLKEDFFRCTKLEENYIFEPKTLIEYAKNRGKEIGLVIDLTATDRYYDPDEFVSKGIEYVKIHVTGHTAHKQPEIIEKFYETVDEFLCTNSGNGKLIGVHCTHGLNRTGYLICRYLIEKDGWEASTAIQNFENCRGYKIERMQYIDSLHGCIKGSKDLRPDESKI